MSQHMLETLEADQLLCVNGGGAIDPDAQWIMMRESGGSATAGHLYKEGKGDGTPGNHSSAYGAFQMIESTRKQYMGDNFQSSDFNVQYEAATRYANERYGGWANAKKFWEANRWY